MERFLKSACMDLLSIFILSFSMAGTVTWNNIGTDGNQIAAYDGHLYKRALNKQSVYQYHSGHNAWVLTGRPAEDMLYRLIKKAHTIVTSSETSELIE